MIRLARITLREIRLPLVEPFQTSTGVVEERRILLLELADADGSETWSECVAETLPTYSPETVDTCWLALSEWIVPIVLGEPFSASNLVHATLERRIRGHRMARATVEMGVWALAASRRGLSLAALLVSESDIARQLGAGPRPFVETGIALGMQPSPEALAERSLAAHAAGYRRIKVKIAPGRDVPYVRAARDALGPGVSLTVDANCSYTLDDADHIRVLETLDTLGLTMIEQPLAHDDLLRHAELQRRLSTPICLDESISSDANTEEMLALGSARMVNLKPGRVGGFQQALAIHDRCARAGIPVWCGGMLECGIGRAYNVALASLPNFTEPGDLSPSSRYWARDVVMQPWTMDAEGRVRVPLERAGLGVDVDEALVDDLTVRRANFRAR
ncbi:MAG: o-succinylbenzoate synthase [Gemmatimonadaceae bacterium]|nr:o-succinylbenzoate synthase [Gemmatimonadaceae bacterium]